MNELVARAGIYRRLVGSRIRAQVEYRLSFVLDVAGNACLTVVDFVEIAVIFHQIPQLRGWSFHQVAFLYGTASVSLAITDLVVGTLDSLPEFIRTGTFDQFLIRPLGTLFQAVTADFALRQLGRTFQGVVVLAVALRWNHVPWTVGRVVMIPVMIGSGCLVFSAIWIAGAAVTFWTVNTMEMTNSFTYGGGLLGSYPMNIYGRWLRRLVLFAIPLAFVNYLPEIGRASCRERV